MQLDDDQLDQLAMFYQEDFGPAGAVPGESASGIVHVVARHGDAFFLLH